MSSSSAHVGLGHHSRSEALQIDDWKAQQPWTVLNMPPQGRLLRASVEVYATGSLPTPNMYDIHSPIYVAAECCAPRFQCSLSNKRPCNNLSWDLPQTYRSHSTGSFLQDVYGL